MVEGAFQEAYKAALKDFPSAKEERFHRFMKSNWWKGRRMCIREQQQRISLKGKSDKQGTTT